MKNYITKSLLFILFFFLFKIEILSQPKSILITYHSRSGNTEKMAQAVKKGIDGYRDITVICKTISEVSTQDLLNASAIIIGSPVYNANPSPEILSFIKTWPFDGQPLKDKLGAVFVTAGGFSSGEELVQSSLLHAMMVYGMIVVGGDGWRAAFGASAIHEEGKYNTQELDPYFLEKGIQLGRRVAALVTKLN
jgi:NAD(P)H dehydrogenase (quinone)